MNCGCKCEKLEKSKAIELDSEIEYSASSIVSKTLAENKGGTLTLFAFDKGQGLSEHSAPFDAIVQLLAGQAEFIIGGEPHELSKGELIVMPANVPHAVKGIEKFKMLLTMFRE
jgi:quercetin dioxygenase-like cupin family protein